MMKYDFECQVMLDVAASDFVESLALAAARCHVIEHPKVDKAIICYKETDN